MEHEHRSRPALTLLAEQLHYSGESLADVQAHSNSHTRIINNVTYSYSHLAEMNNVTHSYSHLAKINGPYDTGDILNRMTLTALAFFH